MPERHRHSFERRPDVAHILDRTLENLHADSHYSATPVASGDRRLTSRSCRSSASVARPYAGLTTLPRSRIANRITTSAMLIAPRIEAYIAPRLIPADSR